MLKESLQKKPNVQLMDLSKLVPNAENPKKPLGKKQLQQQNANANNQWQRKKKHQPKAVCSPA